MFKLVSRKIDISKINTPVTPVLSRDANGNLVSSSIYNTVWYKDAQLISDTTKTIKLISIKNFKPYFFDCENFICI